jgi:hypothetical protein
MARLAPRLQAVEHVRVVRVVVQENRFGNGSPFVRRDGVGNRLELARQSPRRWRSSRRRQFRRMGLGNAAPTGVLSLQADDAHAERGVMQA